MVKERLVYIESASNLLSEQKTCLNNPLNNIEAHIARKVKGVVVYWMVSERVIDEIYITEVYK